MRTFQIISNGIPFFVLFCTIFTGTHFAKADELNRTTVRIEKTGKHLFILSGQSNMSAVQPKRIYIPLVATAFGASNVIVVKAAWSGQPIRRWYKQWKPADGKLKANQKPIGDLYVKMMKQINTAIQGKKIATVTFVWMQGERDAKEQHANVYAASFNGLMKQLETDLKHKNINVVIGRISDYPDPQKKFPDWQKIRKILVELATKYPQREWVNTDDLNGPKNGVHHLPKGYQLMEKRFAEKSILLVERELKKSRAVEPKGQK